ncbi:aminotransferase class IV [Pseudozobellia thermophila]|uniref:D-alanine transaminase n=1 Tax=Pseudozobellia thermophila TaxID=192903 RepID=A0A1M6EJ79_9FLAO|nr:aminotransferase class IV [Pseudozobellia thermophila]SHI85537.1 D-alanine transaminase [Pseudozobellia thermophila]
MADYPEVVYLNGKIIKSHEAKISVFDRGFIFGDGVYEVMVRIDQRFFYKKAHMERLQASLNKIGIAYDVDALEREIPELLASSNLSHDDCLLYIQITRGVAPRKHAYPEGIEPTVLMYALSKKLPDINAVHAKVVTTDDLRWLRCDIKMTSLLGNVMANEYAMANNCYETLLVRDGQITEGSHSNVFFVKDSRVYTHPANTLILNGITRQIVLELCGQLNIEVREEAISLKDIATMDEAFLTGTATQIASIQQINNHYFYKNEAIGTLTQKLQTAFLALKKQKELN